MAGAVDPKSKRATPAAPPGTASQHYVDYDEYVDFQLEKTRANLRATEVFTTLTLLLAVFAGYLLVFVVLDHWVIAGGFSLAARGAMLVILLGSMGVVSFRHVVVPLIHRIHPLYAARVLEQADHKFQGNLLNFVDLREGGQPTSASVVRAIEKRAAVELDRMDVEEAVDRRPLLRAAYALLGIVVLSAAYIILSPKDPFASVQRALLPLAPIGVATETTISDVTPGDDRVPARSTVTIEADIRGKPVDQVQIQFTTADRKFVDHPVEMRRIDSGLPRFRGVLNGENGRGLLQSLDYRLVAGDSQSPVYHIQVSQPPAAVVERISYKFPGYMQLEDRDQEGGAIDGWEGARVTLRGTTNMPVTQARILVTDTDLPGSKGEEVSVKITDGTQLEASWMLQFRTDGTYGRFYRIEVKTASGDVDPDPTHHPIVIRPDQRPDVALLHPTSDLRKPANAIVPLQITASDPDFLLRAVALKCEKNGESLPDRGLFETEFPTRTVQGMVEFDLGQLPLKPGDRLQYWIEARDNKQPTANRTNSPRMSIEIEEPFSSEQEARRDLAGEQQKLEEQLARAADNRNPDAASEPRPDEEPNRKPETEVAQRNPRNGDDQTAGRSENRDEESAEPAESGETAGNTRQESTEQEAFERQLERMLKREQETGARPDQPQPAESTEQDPSNEDQPSQDDEQENPGNKRSAAEQQQKKSGTGQSGTKSSPGRGQSQREGSQTPQGQRPQESAEQESDDPEQGSESTGRDSTPRDEPRPGQSNSKPERGRNGEKPATAKSGNDEGTKKPTTESGEDSTDSETSEEKSGGTPPRERGSAKQTKSSATNRQPDEQNPATPAGNDTTDSDPPSKTGNEPGESKDPPGDRQKTKSPQPRSDQPAGTRSETPDKSGKSPTDDQGQDESSDSVPPEANRPQPNSRERIPEGERPDPAGTKSERSKTGRQKPKTSDDGDAAPKDPDEQPGGQDSEEESSPGDQRERSEKPTGKGSKSPAGQNSDANAESGDEPPAESSSDDGGDEGESSKTPPQQPTQEQPSGAKPRNQSGQSGVKNPRPQSAESPADEGRDETPKERSSGESGADQDAAEQDPGDEKQPAAGSESPQTPRSGSQAKRPGAQGNKPQPRGKEEGNDVEHDDPPSEPANEDAQGKTDPQRRPSNASEVGNQTPQGKGRPQGQKSDQPQAGEKGSSSSSDQGETGGNQEGAGEGSNQGGDAETAEGKTGQSSETQSGNGSKSGSAGKTKSKPGTGGSPSDSDQGAGAEKGAGDSSDDSPASGQQPGKGSGKSARGDKPASGGQPGEGGSEGAAPKEGAEGGQSGSKPSAGGTPNGSSRSSSGGGVSGRPRGDGGQPGDGDSSDPDAKGEPGDSATSSESAPNDEQAKLEHLREASNLVLQKLKSRLERGEVDDELMQELGFKDLAALEKFASRLEEQVNASDDDTSPEALARRRQFDEMLKSMSLGGETQRREQGQTGSRRINQVDAGRRPVPAELRERYEAYTKSLTRRKGDKPTPPKGSRPPAPKGEPK